MTSPCLHSSYSVDHACQVRSIAFSTPGGGGGGGGGGSPNPAHDRDRPEPHRRDDSCAHGKTVDLDHVSFILV